MSSELRTQQSVLVVAPHPDDEAMGCAGTMLLHATAGDAVHIAVATDGRRSRVVPNGAAMASLRHREARRAADLMRARQLIWLGLHEGQWPLVQLIQAIEKLLRELRPDVIYAPSRVDFHPEHLRTAHALACALANTASQAMLRIYQVQVPLTAQLRNRIIDVTSVRRQSEAALRAYVSQAASVACTYRLRRSAARALPHAVHAEIFWEMNAAGYVMLHESAPDTWPKAFRGMRRSRLTDLLAHFTGWRERARLRSLLSERQCLRSGLR